jgi:hypothetical protein
MTEWKRVRIKLITLFEGLHAEGEACKVSTTLPIFFSRLHMRSSIDDSELMIRVCSKYCDVATI